MRSEDAGPGFRRGRNFRCARRADEYSSAALAGLICPVASTTTCRHRCITVEIFTRNFSSLARTSLNRTRARARECIVYILEMYFRNNARTLARRLAKCQRVMGD